MLNRRKFKAFGASRRGFEEEVDDFNDDDDATNIRTFKGDIGGEEAEISQQVHAVISFWQT